LQDLDHVWSALSEDKIGKYSEHDTMMMMIDADMAGVSHPNNILAIPKWKYWGTHWREEKERCQMDKLRKYVVEKLLAFFPSSVPQFLWNNPC
jgi:hypothetical protein